MRPEVPGLAREAERRCILMARLSVNPLALAETMEGPWEGKRVRLVRLSSSCAVG